MHKTRRCNKARFLLASPKTSFGIPDERTPKDVCRVKKNSDGDSRSGRWLWWSLLHWWSKTLLFCSVLYSSGRSQSKFFNIQLCSFEKLWRPSLFWTWKEFPPWNFNRLRHRRPKLTAGTRTWLLLASGVVLQTVNYKGLYGVQTASIPPEIQSRDVAVPCPFTRFAIPPTDRSRAMLLSLARSASKFRTTL